MADATDSEVHSKMPNTDRNQEQVEDEVTIDMKEMIQHCEDGHLLPYRCIYRIPTPSRRLKEESYTPRVVSIGPYHFGNKDLQDMEKHKIIMFKRFTDRAKSSLDDLVRFVKHLEPNVRASYSETISLTEHELVKLTLTDAAFIIELFISSVNNEIDNDVKLSQIWLYSSLVKDLLLLENQLPFFVIEGLFNEAFPLNHSRGHPSFLEIAYVYFGHYNRQQLLPNPNVVIKHFTDLLRLFYLHEKMLELPRKSFKFGSHRLLYNATALHETGIKLKANQSECLLDLEFSGHILQIPQIVVDDDTELLFRNMIALEQCHYHDASYISDYALMLDCLIDTHRDVNLLVHKNIVSNCVGDPKRVALLFNGLSENFYRATFHSEYLDMTEKLNNYCQNPMPTIRRDYCNTAWRTVASIVGIFFSVLTIVQTIVSVIEFVLKLI